MSNVESVSSTHSSDRSIPVINEPPRQYLDARPQRLCTWFNLIPVKKFKGLKTKEVPFLDSFVVIEPKGGADEDAYSVYFEGTQEMSVVVDYGVIFVWYGEDLLNPDRPFPQIFEEKYTSQYISSVASEFEKTHIMDFVENGSDNLHFQVVHLWESSKLYDHVISEETITLQQDVIINYGASTKNRLARLVTKLLPQLHLHHDFVYYGPGMATVAAQGVGKLKFQSLVSLTPQGVNGTRLYVTLSIHPDTFPRWAEKIFKVVSPKRALCDVLAGIMANFVQNEFYADAEIWANKKFQDLNLLPVEKHLADVRRWGESFYPKGFVPPPIPVKSPEEVKWEYLDDVSNIVAGKIHSYSVSGEGIIAFKDSQGEIHVFDAYCPHQGAHLGCGGVLDDDRVRCPFHGFHYNMDGHGLGPNPENRTKFIPGLDMKPIKHKIENGQIQVYV